MTSFRPDHTSSTAQTFTSTTPSGSATPRTVSSVTSVGTFAARVGQDTQIAAAGVMQLTRAGSWVASAARVVTKR